MAYTSSTYYQRFIANGSLIYDIVDNYSALPDPTLNEDRFFAVLNSQGTAWLPGSIGGTFYAKGIYYSDGSQWIYLGVFPYNATQSQVDAGISTDTFVTPNTFANALKWNNYVPYIGATTNVNLGAYGALADYLQLSLTPTQSAAVGRFRWNDDDGTADLVLKGGNVTLQLGQELVKRVVNKSGSNLLEANYQVVKITGATGQRLSIDLAQANNDLNSATTLGIATETINNNQEGFITYSGEIHEINTTGSLQGETWLDGDILYLSPTVAGQLTKVKPTAPNHSVIVGYVESAHAIHGKIFVKVDNGYELGELHDIYAPSPSNKDVLYWNNVNSRYEVAQLASILGYTPVPSTRTLTINGITYDLSADRSWTISSGWGILGNSGTNPSTNFLGTTDATNFIIKVNNGNGSYSGGNTITDGTNHAIQVQTPTNGGTMVTINPNSKNLGNSAVFLVNGIGTNFYVSSNGSGTFTGNLTVGQTFTSGIIQNAASTVFRLANSTVLVKFDYTNLSVLIGTQTNVASSILTTDSTTKGSLAAPRMTKTQRNAIASPAAGLLVVVTGETGGEYLSIYNANQTRWEKVNTTAD